MKDEFIIYTDENKHFFAELINETNDIYSFIVENNNQINISKKEIKFTGIKKGHIIANIVHINTNID